jgi:hypothetical protein
VGVSGYVWGRPDLISGGRGSASRRDCKAIASLRGEMMTQCDEPMLHLMTILLTYLLMQNNYRVQSKER